MPNCDGCEKCAGYCANCNRRLENNEREGNNPFDDFWNGKLEKSTPPSNRLLFIALEIYHLKNIDGSTAASLMNKIVKKELGSKYTIVKGGKTNETR